MKNDIIDYNQMINIIKSQFIEVMEETYNYYSKYEVFIALEQQYIKNENKKNNAIYIVIKFAPTQLFFNQILLPFNITAISEKNKLEVCQKLLLEYSLKYNLELKTVDSKENLNNVYTIRQTYQSPNVINTYELMGSGYIGLLNLTGNFLISLNSNSFTVEFESKNEENETVVNVIECISYALSFVNQVDTQVMFNHNNFTSSVGKTGTLSLSFSTYLVNDDFCNKVLGIALKDIEKEKDGIDTKFVFSLRFANGYELLQSIFKLTNCEITQQIGQLPVVSLGFTN